MKKNKRILAIEFSVKHIKAALASSSKKRLIIERMEVSEFARPGRAEEIEEFLRKFSRPKYDKLVISLPREFFFIRFLKLPASSMEEAKKMMPYQLAKVVPYSLEEVIYDFSVLKTDAGFSEFVIFLVQKKRISALLEAMEKLKIIPFRITISSSGLLDWLDFQMSAKGQEEICATALINIDKGEVGFLMVDKNKILFSRSFAYEADPQIYDGIAQTLSIFEKRFGRSAFARAIFTGSKNEDIISNSGIGAPEYIASWNSFSFKKGLLEKISGSKFSFAAVLGLCLSRDLSPLDFVPDFLKTKKEKSSRRKISIEILQIISTAILIAAAFMFKHGLDMSNYLKILDKRLSEIKVEAQELDIIADKVKIIDRQFRKSAFFSEVIEAVISSLPDNVYLTLLDFQKNGEFSIKGYADEASSVFTLKDSLNKAALLKSAKVKYASKIKQGNHVRVEFLIFGEL